MMRLGILVAAAIASLACGGWLIGAGSNAVPPTTAVHGVILQRAVLAGVKL